MGVGVGWIRERVGDQGWMGGREGGEGGGSGVGMSKNSILLFCIRHVCKQSVDAMQALLMKYSTGENLRKISLKTDAVGRTILVGGGKKQMLRCSFKFPSAPG